MGWLLFCLLQKASRVKVLLKTKKNKWEFIKQRFLVEDTAGRKSYSPGVLWKTIAHSADHKDACSWKAFVLRLLFTQSDLIDSSFHLKAPSPGFYDTTVASFLSITIAVPSHPLQRWQITAAGQILLPASFCKSGFLRTQPCPFVFILSVAAFKIQ